MKEIHPLPIGVPKPGKIRNPLPSVALTALRSIQSTKVCPKGHEFFLEGQAPTGIYILYAGSVDLSVTDAHGRQMVLGRALPGDVLGLSAALSGKCYEETAVAALTCRTGFVKCPDFLQFLGHHPEAAFWVVQLLSDRVTTTLDQLSGIHDLQLKSLRQ
jgi:CRP/FNR family transcriptional regulator, cyclic AMP receptor protein